MKIHTTHPVNQREKRVIQANVSKRKHSLLYASLLLYLLRNLSLPDLVQEEKEALEIRFLLNRDGMIEYKQAPRKV